MSYKFISVCIALFSFVVSFYALSAIKFDKFCQVEKPANGSDVADCLIVCAGWLGS